MTKKELDLLTNVFDVFQNDITAINDKPLNRQDVAAILQRLKSISLYEHSTDDEPYSS